MSARATADAEVLAAPGRMVPAHATELREGTDWAVAADMHPDHVKLTVTSDDSAVTMRIRVLGFFGLMASRDHHRAHPIAIARGETPHGR